MYFYTILGTANGICGRVLGVQRMCGEVRLRVLLACGKYIQVLYAFVSAVLILFSPKLLMYLSRLRARRSLFCRNLTSHFGARGGHV